MAGASIGRIDLDLNLNQSRFNSQVANLNNTTKKSFGAITSLIGNLGAQLVMKMARNLQDFAKSCIKLSSDLQEVQNVVDTTFTTMGDQVENFAKRAQYNFGLSELSAKRYVSTLGAMSKSFGFTEQQAYDMATTVTALSADVASFYNLSDKEAFIKMQSIWTGETETLKSIGVVMTQNALDAYSMEQGIGKTTLQMSEAEKVALRYRFVLDKLKLSQGDFYKTQNSWANQIRILQLNFEQFKTALGDAFIQVLSPIVSWLNVIITKLTIVAQLFADFIKKITGKDISFKSKIDTTGMSDFTGLSEDASDNMTGIASAGDDAAKSAEKAKKALMGFDELNIIDDNKTSSADAGKPAKSTGFDPNVDLSGPYNNLNGSLLETNLNLDALKKKLKSVIDLLYKAFGVDKFVREFLKGIKKINFKSIKENFDSIMKQLFEIFNVYTLNMQKVWQSFMGFFGALLGNLFAVVTTLFDVILEGVNKFLLKNTDKIKEWLNYIGTAFTDGFNNLKDIMDILGNVILSGIEDARAILSDGISLFIQGFMDAIMVVGTILADMFRTTTEKIKFWVQDNYELIQTTVTNILTLVAGIMESIGIVVSDFFTTLKNWWERSGKKTWEAFIDIILDVWDLFLRLFNEVLKPVLDKIKKEFDTLWANHLKPLWNNLLELVSSLMAAFKVLWDNVLKPLIDWIITYLGPQVKNVADVILSVVKTAVNFIVDSVNLLLKILKNIIDFVVNVFTGNWSGAWDNIKNIFVDIWYCIGDVLKGVINLIIDLINGMLNGLFNGLRGVIDVINRATSALSEMTGIDITIPQIGEPLQIPHLANGGYIGKNKPTLAVIGDNKKEGEVVAPESKLLEIMNKALSLSGRNLITAPQLAYANSPQQDTSSLVDELKNLISEMQKAAFSSTTNNSLTSQQQSIIVKIGEDTLINKVISGINQEQARQGRVLINV